MKLVLVDGFPGTGKSTTAQWLALQWQRQGRPCRWFYEQQPLHPVIGLPAGVEYDTWDEYFAARIELWSRFTAAARGRDELIVLESALLQYPVFVTLRRQVEPDVIVGFITRIAAVIAPLAPRLVYFHVNDPDTSYRAITARRGPAAAERVVQAMETTDFAMQRGLRGFDGLLAYWRAHHDVCERAVAALTLRTLVVDAARGDWPSRRRAVAEFLDLSPAADPAPADLARYAGRYRARFKGAVRECTVTVEDGWLVIHDVLWPANRLLPREANIFHAESWPYEVVFEEIDGGTGGSLTISDYPKDFPKS